MQIVCWFQVCLNVMNAGMSCHDHGKGTVHELTSFILKHHGKNNVVLSECTNGEPPSLTFALPKGLRMREGKKK